MSGVNEAAEAAYASLAGGGDGESEAAPVAEAQAAPQAPAAGEEVGTPVPATGETSSAAARDERGRFRSGKTATESPEPGAAAATKPPEEAEAKAQTPTPKPAAVDVSRPPPGLGPLARAKWDATPPEVREDLWRREKETAQALRTSAEARQVREAFERVTQPYQHHFRAAGVDAVTATQALYDAFGRLAGPDKSAAAHQAVQLIRSYNIPLDLLNEALGGEPAQGGQQSGQAPAGVPPEVLAKLQALEAQVQQFQASRDSGATDWARQQLEQFAASHEFFQDVRGDVAKLYAAGYELEQAYEMAVHANPQTREALRQRETEAQAAEKEKAAQRARAASVSVRSAPVATPRAPPGADHYSQAEAAYNALLSGG